jgi:hypothetical protein
LPICLARYRRHDLLSLSTPEYLLQLARHHLVAHLPDFRMSNSSDVR